jgi:hypothetical protein
MAEAPIEPDVSWVGVEHLPVEFGNIFAALIGENAIVLNLGSLVPPVVESEEQLAALRFFPVKPIARIALTPGNLDGLIETLEDARRDYEEFKQQQSQQESHDH